MRRTQVTPFVHCVSVEAQIAFSRDTLGFSFGFHADNYAFLRRGTVAIRLVEVDAQVDLDDPNRQSPFYIDVEGIDDLFKELKPALNALPADCARAPFNQDYGQREFHVSDEVCTPVFFGEAVSRAN